ncbi:hypothetical protein BUALT_BualtUnG0004100 [Buddleja alternifolia]|uniref:Pollen Ole e 1 allergen and extensin family protein n=1 Tax=Buddleja alternifolia TaxID=168488 RepID=A0AAV6W7W7_9LAMI|nr:hypothetical protein BUALT_BualtUnG0004100 [Buddleja alternifolia]
MALKTLLIFVFVAIIATSIAEAQSLLGIVQVNGTLYCSPNGSPSANGNTSPVFPNAIVQVTCPTDVVIDSPASNTTTNTNGVYRITLFPQNNATANSLVSNCRLFVLTPLSNCNPALPSAGLVSNLRFVRTVQISFLRSTYMVAAGFTLQA